MVESSKSALRALLSAGKLVAIVVGVFGLCASVVHGIVWISDRADAREVAVRFAHVETRQDVAEVKATNEAEWRRAIWDQLREVARAVKAPAVPAPVITTQPKAAP